MKKKKYDIAEIIKNIDYWRKEIGTSIVSAYDCNETNPDMKEELWTFYAMIDYIKKVSGDSARKAKPLPRKRSSKLKE